MIRVAHIVNSLDAGGMENGVVNVSGGLAGRGFEFEVWCLEREGAFAERLPWTVPVSVLGKQGRFTFGAVAALRREHARFRPHVLHTHNLGPLIYTALARTGGVVLHGEHAQLNAAELALKPLMLRRGLLRTVQAVHTVSHSLTRDLLRVLGLPSGVLTLVNGVDTHFFSPGDSLLGRAGLCIPEDALVLGMVGRFGEFKRHSLMLEAFERLAGGNPKLHLLIVGGGGPVEPVVREQAARMSFRDRVHFAGLQRDMPHWYRMMDLLVVPSVNEGLSNAVLESMACGIPALCHQACGHSDVITDGRDGWLHCLENASHLAEVVTMITSHPSGLTTAGSNARHTIERSFSMCGMLERYADVYRALTRGRHIGRPVPS